MEFVGLGNYVDLVQDPVFRKVTLNTLLYLLLGVPLTMAAALAAAVGINRLNRFKGLFRVGFYLPVVTSIVAVSVVWKFLYRQPRRAVQHRARLGRHRGARTGSTTPTWRCPRWS